MFVKRTLFTFLGAFALAAAVNPDNICVLVKDGTKIVNDEDCAKFYTCNDGKATPATCSSGYYFDKDGQNCLPKAQVTCFGAVENVCDGVTDGKFVSMPGSCSGWYYCNKGAATPGHCENGLNFNQADQKCEYEAVYGCGAGGGGSSVNNDPNLLCRYIPSGLFFGSAASCKTWQKCNNNIVSAGTCGDYVFNVQSLQCDYESNYDCQQLKGDTSDTGGSASEKCSVDGSVASDPDSCGGYRVCVSGTYAKYSCNTGLYYDPITNKCTNRQAAVNKCDRCQGTSSQFVNKFQDGCTGYSICSNGKTVGEGSCPANHYFNEIYGGCVKNESPDFKVCQQVETPLPECVNCADTGVTNACNTPTCEADETCECICSDGCPLPTLPVCNPCSDDTVINVCNTPTCEANETCECICSDGCPLPTLPVCNPCSDDTVINVCNTPTCEANETCECICSDGCPLPTLPVCNPCSDDTVINVCNTPTCEANETCECICSDGCPLPTLPVCNPCSDDTVINVCNTPTCEANETCECICSDGCPLPTLPVCNPCSDDSVINVCNTPTCEANETCECICSDGCPLPTLPVCNPCSDDTVINVCNTPTCEANETCECVCEDPC